MGEFFKQLITQLSAVWEKLSTQQKIMISSLLVFMFVALLTLVLWSSNGAPGTDKMKRLYSGLNTEDMAEISEALNGGGFDFEFREDGASLYVNKDQYYDIKMALASEGLPADDGVGYELFDKSNFGATDFEQDIRAKRALEGELRKTISSLKEINDCRVHIVFQKSSLFLEEAKDAKASVMLDLRGSRTLSKEQATGIAFLVSNAIEGLKPSNITIVNEHGIPIYDNYAEDGTAGISSKNMDVKETTERKLMVKVNDMLNGILGFGKSQVKIDVDLDFDQIEESSEKFDPESKVVRSEERNESSVKNAPDGDSESESMVSNYEIDKKVERRIREVGNIKRLTISAVVDGVYEKDTAGEELYRERTSEEITKLEALIKNSVGFDLARGDQITVASMQFNNTMLQDFDQKIEESKNAQNMQYIIIAIIVGIFLIVAILIAGRMSKTVTAAMNPGLPEIELPSNIEEHEEIADIPENVARSNELLEKVEIMAENDPNNVAKIIRDWLNEPTSKKKA